MQIHDPAHPGGIIRGDCILASGCVTSIAFGMAIRLEKAGWSRAATWLRLQAQYDLWRARKNEASIVARLFSNPVAG